MSRRHRSPPVTATLGAVYSFAWSDFGAWGVLDCFGQIVPEAPVVATADFRSGVTSRARP